MRLSKKDIIITAILFALCIVSFFIFELTPIKFFEDVDLNSMFSKTMLRLVCCLLIIYLISLTISKEFFDIRNGGLIGLAWSVPCLLVAFANLPFEGLINRSIYFTKSDYIFLYVALIISTSLMEELLFRGLILSFLLRGDFFKKYPYFLTVIISSAIYSLYHFTNILYGANILDTLMQVGYTFLIGCMLSTVYLKTKNIWICILIHAIFDFGGMLTHYVAEGNPWAIPSFWIATIVCGVFCAVHVVMTLVKMERRNVS